jgi:hypothetical protein
VQKREANMQQVLDKYNLIYKAQSEQIRKSEDDYANLLQGNISLNSNPSHYPSGCSN